MKRRVVGGDEWDMIYARRHYCYLQRAGVTDQIKRRIRRRERQDGKRDVRKEALDQQPLSQHQKEEK